MRKYVVAIVIVAVVAICLGWTIPMMSTAAVKKPATNHETIPAFSHVKVNGRDHWLPRVPLSAEVGNVKIGDPESKQVENYAITVNKIHIAVLGAKLSVNSKFVETNDCNLRGTRIMLVPNGSTKERLLSVNYRDTNKLLVTKEDFNPKKSRLTNVRIRGHKIYRDKTDQGWLYYCPITRLALIAQESKNVVPQMFREAVSSFRAGGVK